MILVDPSVWIAHLRQPLERLQALLERRLVLGHAFVRGEIALSSLRTRDDVLEQFDDLPQAKTATDQEVFAMIEQRKWFASGIGFVDEHLLAAVLIMPGVQLWTQDKSLDRLAATVDRTVAWE